MNTDRLRPIFVSSVSILFSLAVVINADEMPLDPKADYRALIGEPVTYEFDYRIIVTPPHHTEQLRVWLPVPPSDSVQHFELLETETFPLSVESTTG